MPVRGDEFSNQLLKLKQAKLMSGQVQAAAAELMGTRMRAADNVVSNLNEDINLIDSTIRAPEERIADVESTEEFKQEALSIQDMAASYQNLQEFSKKKATAYNIAYGRALLSLGEIGGEESRAIMEMIAREQGIKLSEVEKELETPLRAIEYESAVSNYVFSKEKLDSFMSNKVLVNDASKVSEYIQSLNEYHDIPDGKLNLTNAKTMNDYNNQVAKVKQMARKYFEEQGIKLSPNAVDFGYKIASDYSGKSVQFTQTVGKTATGTATGFTINDHFKALDALRKDSSLWRSMNPVVQSAVQDGIMGASIEEVVAAYSLKNEEGNYKFGLDEDLIGTYVDKFGAGGLYSQNLSTLQQTDPQGMGYVEGRGWIADKMKKDYSSIYVTDNPLGFGTDKYVYSPTLTPEEARSKADARGLGVVGSNWYKEAYGYLGGGEGITAPFEIMMRDFAGILGFEVATPTDPAMLQKFTERIKREQEFKSGRK